jgi:ketosteroid isomerase-like protein
MGDFNMIRFTMLALAFALPVTAGAQDEQAKKEAQAILDKGAALFDTRDATAMAATYTEDAEIHWISKTEEGEIKVEVKKGRAEIENLYRDIFKNASEKTTSRNTVEFARLVASDILIIEGLFQPNVDNPGKYPFTQVRIKQGDKWLMKSLQFFVVSQD